MSRAYVRKSRKDPRWPWIAGCTNSRHGRIGCKTWAEAMRYANDHARHRKHEIRGGKKNTPPPVGRVWDQTPYFHKGQRYPGYAEWAEAMRYAPKP